MKIVTASGHVILADDEDQSLISQFNWHAKPCANGRYYAAARRKGTSERVLMHRLLMNPLPGLVVHHKNNDGLDNRRCNLQVTTQRVNIRYAYMMQGGVHFQDGRWRAQPRDETGSQVSLGMFDTEDQARAVVQNWTYRKMLKLETSSDAGDRDLGALLAIKLGFEP